MGVKIQTAESDVQEAITTLLGFKRYDVMITSRVKKRCSHCHRHSGGGDGATKGLPDLVIRHPSWPAAMALLVEVKRPGGKWSSPEQKAFHERGGSARVESVGEMVLALRQFEERHGLEMIAAGIHVS